MGVAKLMIIGRLSQQMIAAHGVAETLLFMDMTYAGALSARAAVSGLAM